jgi:hypothetical protein
MQQRITLDPQLGLSANEFIPAWNQSKHSEDAVAMINEESSEKFMAPELTVALIAVAASIPAGVLTAFISALLTKRFLEKEKPEQAAPTPKISVTIIEINGQDGQPLMIAKRIEKEG